MARLGATFSQARVDVSSGNQSFPTILYTSQYEVLSVKQASSRTACRVSNHGLRLAGHSWLGAHSNGSPGMDGDMQVIRFPAAW